MANANQFTTKFETVSGATTPNNSITTSPGTANTEFTLSLTGNVKQVFLRCQEQSNLQIAFTASQSGTNYWTIRKGSALILDNLNVNSPNIYVQADQASVNIELMYWT